MTRDPRGPKVELTLSFGAQSKTAYVREMTPDELRETLNDWIRWRSIHGRGRSEAAVQFRVCANPQISRLRGELRRRTKAWRNSMTEKCTERCPRCEEDTKKYGDLPPRISLKRKAPHEGLPLCSRHGCVLVDGEWIFECYQCKSRVDALYGLFVPFLCKDCLDKAVAAQRRAGKTCGICGQVRMLCCC